MGWHDTKIYSFNESNQKNIWKPSEWLVGPLSDFIGMSTLVGLYMSKSVYNYGLQLFTIQKCISQLF